MRIVRFLPALLLAVACNEHLSSPAPASSAAGETSSALGGSSEASGHGLSRQIIRDMDMTIEVSDAEAFLRALDAVAGRSGGYVSDRHVGHSSGRVSSGTLTVRVPADRLDATTETLRAVGVVQSESMSARDISEKYADLGARLSSQRALEQRLLRLLDERAGVLADVVAMESKLGEVREQIEQLEGRQRLWDSQVALATIRITFRVVPQSVAKPGFTGRVAATVRASALALATFLRGVALVLAALLPWVPLAAIGWFAMRRLVRSSHQSATSR